MGRKCLSGVILLGVTLLWGTPVAGQSFSGVVTEVKNGDTIVVQGGEGGATVRLYGVDAPEPGQPYGREATDYLRALIQGRSVRVQVRDRDRIGRLVGTVVQEGTHVNRQLLRAGLAWYYWWYIDYSPEARRAQSIEYRAQQADRGLWAQTAPIPPWEWRDEGHAVSRTRSGPTGLRYNPNGRPRTCDDFETQAQAQRFFEAALPRTARALDTDGDGTACERLPTK